MEAHRDVYEKEIDAFFRHVHVGFDEVHRDFGRSVESLRGRFERNLSVRFAGIARRVQGCVG